jgi:hypothetical protein
MQELLATADALSSVTKAADILLLAAIYFFWDAHRTSKRGAAALLSRALLTDLSLVNVATVAAMTARSASSRTIGHICAIAGLVLILCFRA